MISKNYIKNLFGHYQDGKFKTDSTKNINDLYNYIIDSYIIGARKQSKELYNKLSKTQLKEFLNYCENLKEMNNFIEINEILQYLREE